MDTLEDVAEWCTDHEYMMVVEYHGKVRQLNPLATFSTQAFARRLSAFDSTHPGEESPRTYKFEDLTLLGITRIQIKAVSFVRQTDQGTTTRHQGKSRIRK